MYGFIDGLIIFKQEARIGNPSDKTLRDLLSMRTQELVINDAVVQQAEADAPTAQINSPARIFILISLRTTRLPFWVEKCLLRLRICKYMG